MSPSAPLARMPFEELQKHEAVVHLGHQLGVTLMDRIKEQVMKMDDQQRVVFYSAMLKAPVGCMRPRPRWGFSMLQRST